MASAVDSRLAYARLSAVATASRLPTANRGSNNSYTTSWDTTRFDFDAVVLQMIVLRLPAVTVVDNNAITSKISEQRRDAHFANTYVRHAITCRADNTRGSGNYGNAPPHIYVVSNPEVGPSMIVVTHTVALVVAGSGSGLLVDILLDEADNAHFAVDGQTQTYRLRCASGRYA